LSRACVWLHAKGLRLGWMVVVSWRDVRLARRDEGAARWALTEEATPSDGRLAGKPGSPRSGRMGFGA